MELSEKDIKDLKQEIQHIFDSGANEIRVFEMVKMFTERRFVKLILPVVSITFKERCKKDIEELEKYYKEVQKDTEKQFKDIDDWSSELSFIRGNIEGLKTALNYC
jgi:hypothetical protein